MFYRTDKRRILFIKDIAEIPTIIGRKNIKATTERVVFQKHPYTIDTTKPTYRRKGTFIYILDIDQGQRFFKGENKSIVTKELTGAVFLKEIARQLVTALTTKGLSEVILYVLLSIGMGVGIGYIIKSIMG